MRYIYQVLIISLFLINCTPGYLYYYRKGYNQGENHYEYIINHNKSMANAFSIAENWIAKNYNSANNVIQQKDKDNGIIVVKGLTPFTISDGLVSENRNVNYTMEIRVKDNKSKIVIDLGVIAAEGNFSAPPECAPPSNEMPKIISAFEKIKNGLNTEWNSSINASDF